MRYRLVAPLAIASTLAALASCSSRDEPKTPTPDAAKAAAPPTALAEAPSGSSSAAPPPTSPAESPDADATSGGPDADTTGGAGTTGTVADAVGDSPRTLRLVATREGPLELRQWNGGLVLMLEGEPVPVIDGKPVRQRGAAKGIFAPYDEMPLASRTLAFGGDPSVVGGAWVTTVHEHDRAADDYTTYEPIADGWRTLDLRQGRLEGYYAAIIERGGARLALRVWSTESEAMLSDDGEEPDPKAKAESAAFQAELARAKPAWVHLSGPKVQAPTLPPKVQPFDAVTTEDGTVYALAMRSRKSEQPVVLVWPQGASQAQQVALPGVTSRLVDSRLWTSGSWVLATGSMPENDRSTYLAMGRGGTWEAVAVDLPGRPADAPSLPLGAARTPSGELWLALGDPWMGDDDGEPSVWRRPSGEAWQPVPLPAVAPQVFGRASWILNAPGSGGGWIEVERPPLTMPPAQARGLVWADGENWVSLQAGSAYAGTDVYTAFPRTLLLTTAPGDAKVVALPSSIELAFDRYDQKARTMKLDDYDCETASLLLGPPPDDAQQAALAQALQALDDDDALDAAVGEVYVGRLDRSKVLAATVHLTGEHDPTPLLEAVRKATGLEGKVVCRIPRLVRMIADD
ncbi:MAG: hypothetical protein KDK70_29200 [Myxococcales bacterium]|nr:hypothetical protein [Myxococcales bacterium]